MVPPPRQMGERLVPARALPVPFCRQGFLPPPLTSSRLFVECVPRRWLARYCLTASQSRLWFGVTAKTSSASSSCLTVAPSKFLTSTVAMLVSSQPSAFSYQQENRVCRQPTADL